MVSAAVSTPPPPLATLPGSGEGERKFRRGGKGISGREGTGYGVWGVRGMGSEVPREGVPLDPGAAWRMWPHPPSRTFPTLRCRAPRGCSPASARGHPGLDSGRPGDPGVRAPEYARRTFDQIRAKLPLRPRPPPPFPCRLLLFLEERSEHPRTPAPPLPDSQPFIFL